MSAIRLPKSPVAKSMLRVPGLAVMLFYSLVVFSSCGPSKPLVKESEYALLPGDALDARYFHSPLGDIAGHFPKDWLLINIENFPDFPNVLFVYSDPTRTDALVLSEIPGTAELRRNVERDGISALAQQSFLLKSGKPNSTVKLTREPEVFTLNSKLFSSYEFTSRDSALNQPLDNRAVVFTTGVRFYELAMVELIPNGKEESERKTENFRLLQSVIASLEGVAEVRRLVTGGT